METWQKVVLFIIGTAVWLCVLGGLIYLGYQHFFKEQEKPVPPISSKTTAFDTTYTKIQTPPLQPVTPTITPTPPPIVSPPPIVAPPATAPSVVTSLSPPVTATPPPPPVETRPPPQLIALPLWCKSPTLEGIVEKSGGDELSPVFLRNLQATPTTEDIEIKGDISRGPDVKQFAGVLKGTEFTLMEPAISGGQSVSFQIKTNAKGDEIEMVYDNMIGRFKIPQAANAFQLAPQMTCILIYGCKRYQSQMNAVVVIDDSIAVEGSDEFGEYVMYGKGVVSGSTTSIRLAKAYGYGENETLFIYSGSVKNGIVTGTWEENGFPENKAEFRMFPKGMTFNEDIPLYGPMCQYPANWKGSLTLDGEYYHVDVSNFKVVNQTITADLKDEWGTSKFVAELIGRNFKGTKTYTGGSPIQQTGTISIENIQGNWVSSNPPGSGTFMYTPQ